MTDWIHGAFTLQGVVASLLLLAALVMIGIIYLLRDFVPAHSHAGVRRLGWQRSLLFLGLPLLPYWNLTVAFTMMPTVLLTAAFQLERLWMVRGLGLNAYEEMLRTATAGSSLPAAVASSIGAGLLVIAAAFALWFVAPDAEHDWSYWFAAGLVLHAIGSTASRIAVAVRAFRTAR